MSARERAEAFLKIASQFQLGGLVTESSHPVTANLSETAQKSAADGLRQLFEVDLDVLERYRRLVEEHELDPIVDVVYQKVKSGGRLFFTGCGSTGRLSIQLTAIWREFWAASGVKDYEDRAFAAMAGGDFALIKSVEGFEDHEGFGRKQVADLGIGEGDVCFAITEGGETTFVIGTAWEALDRGADVFFVYNNPDEVLTVERSQKVIAEPRITKLNLTTGPMSIMGSTRMQATTIEQLAVLTVLERVICRLLGQDDQRVESITLNGLQESLRAMREPSFLQGLGTLVEMEEATYRHGGLHDYCADRLAIDVLTDTTERSPTFTTPPFRKFDDVTAAESWSFLRTPHATTEEAWRSILARKPNCVEWTRDDIQGLIADHLVDRAAEVASQIGESELMRFKIDAHGDQSRRPTTSTLVLGPNCDPSFWESNPVFDAVLSFHREDDGPVVNLPKPEHGLELHLQAVTRAAAKMVLNALSTCIMVRLGRVMGNTMIYVAPSNLKLIDRSTRYVMKLTDLAYEAACHLVHQALEHVEGRMQAAQSYPPVVGLAVKMHEHSLDPAEAERRFY